MATLCISENLKKTTLALKAISDTAQLDAQILLTHALNKDITYLLTWPDKLLSKAEQSYFEAHVAKRLQGEPIAYIVGHRGFWDLDLDVNTDVLIPRPETESLVEHMLNLADENQSVNILDLGTGSGAIALAVAKSRPKWQVHAVDASSKALHIAKHNAEKHHITNVKFSLSHWFDALDPKHKFDIIASNPPYIAMDDPHLSEGDVRFEPKSALVAEQEGLSDIIEIIEKAPLFLNPNGILIFEHGYDQAAAIRALFKEAGYLNIQSFEDYNGVERNTLALRPTSRT